MTLYFHIKTGIIKIIVFGKFFDFVSSSNSNSLFKAFFIQWKLGLMLLKQMLESPKIRLSSFAMIIYLQGFVKMDFRKIKPWGRLYLKICLNLKLKFQFTFRKKNSIWESKLIKTASLHLKKSFKNLIEIKLFKLK